MNKSEAQAAIESGKKVTHTYFTDGEWVTVDKDNPSYYIYEDGALTEDLSFWAIRTASGWDEGWSIVDDVIANPEDHKSKLKLSSPFTVIMTDKVECCDLYPFGSIHDVQLDDEGNRWVVGRVDCIPKDYPLLRIAFKQEFFLREGVQCDRCKNIFRRGDVFTDGWCYRCNEQNKR